MFKGLIQFLSHRRLFKLQAVRLINHGLAGITNHSRRTRLHRTSGRERLPSLPITSTGMASTSVDDDVMAVVKKNNGQLLLDHLNSQTPRIEFTMEDGNGGSLPFTYVRLKHGPQGKLFREVYQKQTHTNRYVQIHSHHPSVVKRGGKMSIQSCCLSQWSSEAA